MKLVKYSVFFKLQKQYILAKNSNNTNIEKVKKEVHPFS